MTSLRAIEKCLHCDGGFQPRRNGGRVQRYCSAGCRQAAKIGRARGSQRLPITNRCEQCGGTFHPFYEAQRFCDSKCKGVAQRVDRRRTCDGCGAEFERGHHRQRFCSRQCHYDSHIGNTVNAGGYLREFVPRGTPGADGSGRMLQHRYVMQQAIGRPLEADETVHHINGDKLDNRLENLQLRIGRHGKGARYVCRCCGSDDVVAVEIGEE